MYTKILHNEIVKIKDIEHKFNISRKCFNTNKKIFLFEYPELRTFHQTCEYQMKPLYSMDDIFVDGAEDVSSLLRLVEHKFLLRPKRSNCMRHSDIIYLALMIVQIIIN